MYLYLPSQYYIIIQCQKNDISFWSVCTYMYMDKVHLRKLLKLGCFLSQPLCSFEGNYLVIIKGSLSSSWMNSPTPSLLLPLWQNKWVNERNYWYENICHLHGHSHENQVIFMGNVWHKHSFCKKKPKVYICVKRPIRPALIKNNLTKKQFTIFSWSVYNVQLKALDIKRVVQGSLWHSSRT